MIRKGLLTLCALLCVAPHLSADGRGALVIGNSAYTGNPLSNPVNDATDIAASLKAAGFEVILRTDQDLAGMEGALADFHALLKGKDTALFYYAGHGLQVDGENYLIPVKENIQSSAQAQAALDTSRTELAGLDAKLAELQKKIALASDDRARQKLQIEEQRQQALQQAKALEADSLARDAVKQKAAAEVSARLAGERAAAQAANAKAQSDLSSLASARRAELDKLATAAASENPDVLIDTVERLEVVLKEVDGLYAAALQKSLDASNTGWDKQLASLKLEQPDITESDTEFAARQNQEKSALEARRKSDTAGLRGNVEAQRILQTAAIRKQYDDTLRTLQTKVWTVTGSAAVLTIGTFDRNAKTWPFTVGSNDPTIPMQPVDLVARPGSRTDPKAAILALDAAVKANALSAEFDWGITRDMANKRYAIDIREARVRNLTTNEAESQSLPNQRAAYFVAGKRATPVQAGVGNLVVSAKPGSGEGEIYIEGKKVGTTPLALKLAGGMLRLQVRWADIYSSFSQQITIGEGQTTSIIGQKRVLKVGDLGPAGGLIFYNKGNASEGWRFLEAAPSSQTDLYGIQWHNGNYIDIKTSTAVGTGRANTEAIIAAQGSGSYAATLCKNLSIGGFSDWFLPSKDELGQMYTSLMKAGLGGFGEGWLWSSSQGSDGGAWSQRFSVGSQSCGFKYAQYAVRACRAF